MILSIILHIIVVFVSSLMCFSFFFFFFNDTATTEIYTLSLHDALPICFPPAGSADPTTRIIGAALAQQLSRPVVVENRPGADSAIAAEALTRLAPDGYTIMFASNSAMTAAVALRKNPAYDPLTDFTPISMVGRATVFLYSHPSVPATTLKECVDYE